MEMKQGNDFNSVNGSEQIGLIDLILQLWRGKTIIIVTTIITLFLATSYIFLAKEKWVSTAIVTQPDAGQISGYTHALGIIYGDSGPRLTEVQKSIIERFGSAFSALSETLSNREVVEKLTIEPAVKEQALPLKLTYTASNAVNAQKGLANYIQIVDDQVAKELEVDMASTIASKEKELNQFLSSQTKIATEQKDLRVAQIEQALTVARQAEIKAPKVLQADQVSQDTMFMLGSDALASMVRNEASRPLAYPDSYYETRRALLNISNLKIGASGEEIKAENLHAYRYVMKPTLPIHRDSPKRIIVLILALFVGGMLGATIVLAKNAIVTSKK